MKGWGTRVATLARMERGVRPGEEHRISARPSTTTNGSFARADRPRVLIYDPDSSQGHALASHLRCSNFDATVVVLTARVPIRDLGMETPDVCLINLASERFDGLAVAAELVNRSPWVEAVFWFDEGAGAPAAEAARSLGIRRLIPADRLTSWLDGALPQLARMARAHREHADAENALPPQPTSDRCDVTLPLPVAERRFREAYLRRMLSVSESHSAAARRAGLPYTTFRSMLKKFGIV